MNINATTHRIAWHLFRTTRINLHQIYAAMRGAKNGWTRPFDRLPLRGVGAEIGVYRGIHAYNMLKRHPLITKLYLCDGYEPYAEKVVGKKDLLREARESCRDLMEGKPVEFIYDNSPECAQLIPDNSLNFCYIDGAHNRRAVREDVLAMWPKIKSGGILGGHDCTERFNDVINGAIDGLFKIQNILRTGPVGDLYVETPDWWVFKP